MLLNIIKQLREELRPLVEDSLRLELEPMVRKDLKAALDLELRGEFQGALQKEFENRVEEQSHRYERLLADIGRQTSESISHQLATQVEQVAGRFPAEFLEQKLASQIDQLVQLGVTETRSKVEASLRTELEPVFREHLNQQLTTEISREIRGHLELEKSKLFEDYKYELLLKSVRESEIEVLRDVVAKELTVAMSPEIRFKLINELAPPIRHELRVKVRQEFENSQEFRTSVERKVAKEILPDVFRSIEKKLMIDAIRQELEGRPEIRLAAKEEVKAKIEPELRKSIVDDLRKVVRRELASSLAPEVEKRLNQELSRAIILDQDGNLDGTVAGVLRKSIPALSVGLRESLLDELWPTIAEAFVEAFAVVCDLNRKEWDLFLRVAEDLVDDRILPKSRQKSLPETKPDGFYRAIKRIRCSLTEKAIKPGQLYFRFKGQEIRVPFEADETIKVDIDRRLDFSDVDR